MAGGRALADEIGRRRALLWALLAGLSLITVGGSVLLASGADVVPEGMRTSTPLRLGAATLVLVLGGAATWMAHGGQRRCEEALRLLLEEQRNSEHLTHIDSLRRDAVATTVHDLRTPLTSILGSAKTLLARRDQLDPTSSGELLALIEKQSVRLAELIDSVLDPSRIEAGALMLRREPIDLRDLTVEVVSDLLSSPLGTSRDVRIKMDPDYPNMWGDPVAVQQIVANLVENALKYGGDPIEVEVADRAIEIVLTVSDQGSGIPPNEVGSIFDKFKRVGGVEGEGTGLGLYIVGNLVEAQGGSIRVESDPAIGTRFTVRFPKRSTDRTLDLTT